MLSAATLLQSALYGLFAVLGALIGGITALAVAEKNNRHTAALERRRAKLAKGEELVAVLSELSSWRARDDQELLTELGQLEAKLNRAYALAITYYGDEENISSDFYNEGLKVMAALNESAEEYSGNSPPVDLKTINFQYAVFQAASRILTAYVLREMQRINAGN
jgi:hypothetical protein